MSSSFDTSDNLFVSSQDAGDDAPDFEDLFGEPGAEDLSFGDEGRTGDDDERFQRLEVIKEEPKHYFRNASYYQDALGGLGDIAKRLHATLAQFLKADNPEDRSNYRSRLIPVYWDVAKQIAQHAYGKLPDPKKLVLRFGVLLPTMLDKEQRLMIAQIIDGNERNEPIHYVDEWLARVARGDVNVSATDETKAASGGGASKLNRQLESARGKVEAQLELIRTRNVEMEGHESRLAEIVKQLLDRETRPESNGQRGPYTESQRALFSEISSELRTLSNQGREMGRAYNELEKYQDTLSELENQAAESGEDMSQVDAKASVEEMGTIRQMAKLCVGRQGNHFPLLYKQYFKGGLIGVATRENVHNILADVEYLDPSIFQRTFKQKTTRIVPNIILVPCYGDLGVCWEPFERYNRATSRGRLAVPMYPKDLKSAVIAALGDLRWQVAKEKAAHYWMEEGLTGWYYQWFTEQKLKGDVKDQFIQDYILWITKESEGTQKLERDVRAIFWRYMPFPQELKDKLKNRGFVYSELYKKDQNRAMSDGY
ncbi:MAG: hypothetical protein ACLFR8_03680 [Alkalispirochaeta sp.]